MNHDAISDLFAGLGPVSIRRMFGGKGIYFNGVIIAVELRGELMLKGDAIVAPVVDAVLIALLWLAVIRRLPCRDAAWQGLAPGAVLFGVGAVLIGSITYNLLGAYASQRESTYGTLGLAAALLLVLFIAARLVVAAAVLNATLWERRTPAR